MKHKIILTIAVLATSIVAGAQTIVTKYTPGVTTDGVVYYLPQTVLKIAVTATRTTLQPGDFHNYAKRFLRLNDVPHESKTEWKIDKIQVLPVSAPDTSKAHLVVLKKGTSAPLCTLTDNGVLLSINAKSDKYVEPAVEMVASKSTTKVNSRDFLNQDILSAGSEQKMAELTAIGIYGIRESRSELIKGEADYMPKDGEQLKLMLAKLDEEENGLMQLFEGSVETETKTWVVYYSPKYGTENDIIARFSDQQGLVDKENLSGAPIYIDVKNLNTVKHGITELLDKKLLDKVVYYNIPSQATVTISFQNNSLVKLTLPIAQFGHEEYLSDDLFNKRATCHIWFNPCTGNIEKIEDDSLRKQ